MSDKKESIRLIKRLKDGKVTEAVAGMAARLVSKGQYAYVDGGPDESAMVKPNRRYITASKEPSMILQTSPVERLVGGSGEESPEIDVVTSNRSSNINDKSTRSSQKIRRVSDYPKETIDRMLQVNSANPAQAQITKSSGSLKALIDKTRANRSK